MTDSQLDIAKRRQQLLASMRAQRDAMIAVRESAGGNVWAYQSCVVFAKQYNANIKVVPKLIGAGATVFEFDDSKITNRNPNDMTAPAQKSLFDNCYMQVLNVIALLEVEAADQIGELDLMCSALESAFRPLFFEAPTREREVQDNFERFLVARGMRKPINFDRETGRVKVAGKEFVPDFVLPPLGAAVELKLVTEKSNVKTVIEELNADIAAYSTVYKAVIALVYDVGQIRDVGEFERGLQLVGFVRVITIKH